VALAVLLTALTNLVGIFTVPFLLTVLVGAFGEVELSAGELLGQLILSILLPLAAGKGLRHLLVPWIEPRRYGIGLVSNVALISVPWMKFSQSSESLARMAVAVLAGIILAGLLIHGLYLAFNLVTTRMLGFPPPVRKAVVFLASQKTLPVALTVLAFLPVPETVKGLVAIPCVTSHLSQIFVDAVIATRWGQLGSGSDSA
jgi:sodium/bile acid cotransporter 7